MGVYCWQSVVVLSYGVSTCESLRLDHALIASITPGLRRQLETAGRLRIWFPPGFVVIKVYRSRQPMGYARPGLITYLLLTRCAFRGGTVPGALRHLCPSPWTTYHEATARSALRGISQGRVLCQPPGRGVLAYRFMSYVAYLGTPVSITPDADSPKPHLFVVV